MRFNIKALPYLFFVLFLTYPAVAQTVSGSVLPGTVFMWAGSTCPAGSITADGRILLRTGSAAKLYLATSLAFGYPDGTHFYAPDLRGRFIRMVDGTAGRDPDASSRIAMNGSGATGNSVGSVQLDGFKAHVHSLPGQNTGPAIGDFVATSANNGSAATSASTGGNETRPLNAYLQYCVKY